MFSGFLSCLFGMYGFVLAFLSYFVFSVLGEAGGPCLFWVVFIVCMLCLYVLVFFEVPWGRWGDVVVCSFWSGVGCVCMFFYGPLYFIFYTFFVWVFRVLETFFVYVYLFLMFVCTVYVCFW